MIITKEKIITQVNELKKLMDGCDTIEEAKNRSKKHQITIYTFSRDSDCEPLGYNQNITEKDIDGFRVESYKNLCYIYFYKDGMIMFDVWDDDINAYDRIMVDVTLETLDAHIAQGC